MCTPSFIGLPALGLGQPGRILTASAIYTPFDGSSREFESALFGDIAAALSTQTRAQLDPLLEPPGDDRSLPSLADLKADPGHPSVETVRKEFDKLKAIDRLGLPETPFRTIPRKTLTSYRARAATEPPNPLKDRVDASRYALVSIYCWVRRREITDDLVELLIRLVDQRAYLNRMLRLALPFFRRRNIPRENASSNARYPGLAGYAIHAAPARSIWISRSLLTVTHFLGRTAAKSWVSPKTGAPAPPPPRPPSLPSPPPAGY